MKRIFLLILCIVFLANFPIDAKIFEEGNKFYVEQELTEGYDLIAGISFSEKVN